jgi:hypothetical protein
MTAAPLGFAVEAVARNAGLVADDGAARSDDAVEERRFAHIRAADDGEERSSRVRRIIRFVSSTNQVV